MSWAEDVDGARTCEFTYLVKLNVRGFVVIYDIAIMFLMV